MATNTYVALDKVTVGTATASVTFSSISSAYTDLYIVGSVGVTAAADIFLNFNGDTTSGLYSFTQLGGDGSSAFSQRASNQNRVQLDFPGYAQTTLGATNFTISVQNYSNSTTNKTSLTRFNNLGGAAGLGTNATVGLWRNTNAVTSITLTASGTTFLAGSTFSLYGIKADTNSTPKATGGFVSSDATYWYHTYAMSGTFTPNQTLSCDILTIAGGGAGGRGGGGAGGLVYLSSQSVAASAQTITVGGGGAQRTTDGAGLSNAGSNSQFASLTAAVGGGAASGYSVTGGTGGSGGGAGWGGGSQSGGSPTSGQGFAGGNNGNGDCAGGGGGAGGVGANGATGNPGVGGVGSSTYSSWGLATTTGQNVSGTVFYAGGGGGSGNTSQGDRAGGNGGGGTGKSSTSATPTAGTANTGGGGGGGSGSTAIAGGAGGSGIVIVRYLKA
jgi:hypothetical protein